MKLRAGLVGPVLAACGLVECLTLQNSFTLDDETLPLSQFGELGSFEGSESFISSAFNYDSFFKGPQNKVQVIKSHTSSDAAQFQTLRSVEDSRYSLRVKEHDAAKLGVDDVKQWSGYLDYEDKKHFFYWFFESRNDPKNDPVILWLNGGPGCSSFTGLFFELGPSSIGKDLKPVRNPYSWNTNASVIFLEQPIGVGFSYGDGTVDSTAIAGQDVFNFLQLFFKKFSHLAGNGFHIAGESYAGHYIPQIAHEIISRKEDEDNKVPVLFNLTSILIGNGLTDPKVQNNYYAPMACGEGGIPPVIDENQCQKMNASAKRCESLTNLCYLTQSSFPCILAATYCDHSTIDPVVSAKLNIYDLRKSCDMRENPLCYEELAYVEEYLNQPNVLAALGSDVQSYEGCSNQVAARFALTGDNSKPFFQYVAELLDRDIPVLIYAGDQDYICNWLGNYAWTNQVGWRHTYKYRTLPLKPWINKETGDQAGEVKSFGALTFLRVHEAGHMVPHDQPENSLYMVNNWIAGNYNLDYKLD